MITNADLLAFFKDSITKTALSLSRAPVGSSAKIRRGLLMKQRIIAILSFSPPDSFEHFLSKRSLLIEKLSISDSTFFFAVATLSPFNKAGSMMLYKAVCLSNK